MTTEAQRDRQVARETVRPRSECPHCNPPRGDQPGYPAHAANVAALLADELGVPVGAHHDGSHVVIAVQDAARLLAAGVAPAATA